MKGSSGFMARARRRLSIALAVSLVPVTAALWQPVQAAAGDLDPAFGTGGIADAAPSLGSFDAQDQVLQPDGKIVVVGGTGTGSSQNTVMARFMPDGSLDPTFGTGGVREVNFVTGQRDLAVSVAIANDGKIVIGGNRYDQPNFLAYVARFAANGQGAPEVNIDHGIPTYTLGGHIALLPGAPGAQQILLGMWNESTRITVYKLNADGLRDMSFGTSGVAFADFGVRAVIQDLELSPDASFFEVSGHIRTSLDDAGVARFVTATGLLDPAFGSGGKFVQDFGSGGHDHATSIKIDSSGRTVVASNRFAGADPAKAFRITSAGSLDPTFGSAGVFTLNVPGASATRATGIALDNQERPVLSVTAEGVPAATFSVQKLTVDGQADSAFGTAGLASAGTCGGTRLPLVQPDDKIVVMGACLGNIRLARFLDSTLAGIRDVSLTVTPSGDVAANRLALNLNTLSPDDRASLLQSPGALQAIQSSPLRSSPLRSSPLRSSPLRSSPLRSSPLRSSPLRSSPLRSSELGPILLSSIPLLLPGGWSAILNDATKVPADILNLPPQSVLLSQLPDSAIEGITLGDLDLSSTPLRSSSLTAVLFGNTPLGSIPAPAGGWCPLIAGQPVDCTSSPSALNRSLLSLELAGVDLGPVLSHNIALNGASLDPTSPLATLALDNIELADTPIGGVAFTQAPSLFECTGPCPTSMSLAGAQADDTAPDNVRVASDKSLNDLLALNIPGFSLSLGQLIVGLVPVADIPYEDIPLDLLAALAPPDDVVYETAFTVSCSASSNVQVDFDLPEGFRPVPGTGYFRQGVEGFMPLGDPGFDSETGLYTFWWNEGSLCFGTGESLTGAVGFHVNIGDSLRATEARSTVRSDSVPDGVSDTGAELRLFDGGEGLEITPDIEADYLYTGHISSAGDVDLFDLPAPSAGSVVTVYLSHLPADYDLVLYGSSAASSAPLRSSPLRSSPLRSSPLRSSPVGDDGLDPTASADNVLAPETLQDVPLRSSPLRSSSLQRDTRTEVVSTLVGENDVDFNFQVQVSGYNGAFSSEPYMLRVKVTSPAEDLPCITRSFGTTGVQGSLPLPDSIPANTETLFLVNQKRLGDMYGSVDDNNPLTADDWGSRIVSRLGTLAAYAGDAAGVGAVRGVVLPIDGDAAVRAAYDAWDADPCNVTKANEIVASINSVVDGYRANLANLRNIVLVGSDDMVPMGRLADLTTLSNQQDYRAEAAPNGLDNPISRAFARGYLLSDDPYGDFDPGEWLNGKLYVPDVALGRLVERPAEIMGAIDRYLSSQGRLDTSSSFTAGYDFLIDGAAEVDSALRQNGPSGPTSLINNTWTRNQIVRAWNGQNADGTQASASPKVVSVNGHYDHYRALPALDDSNPGIPADLLTASDLASSSLPTGALLFSMGCQGGLNLPDVFAAVGDPRGGDWAQTAAQRQSLLAGNSGYGYGDSEAVAYSERIYSYFAQGLDGTASVGQAMTLAKQRYLRGLGVAGVFDAKAMEEAIFYGLPMYRLGAAGQAPSLMPPPPAPAPPTPTVVSSTFDESPNPTSRSGPRGAYYAVGSQLPQVTHYRPITPRMEVPVTPVPGLRAHGVFLEQIDTIDVDNSGAGVDPVYSMPTSDLAANEPEPSIDGGIFPTNVTNLTRTASSAGTGDTLVLLPGQFFTDGDLGGRGVQRLFRRMGGTILHSDSSDFVSPSILSVEAGVIGGTGIFDVKVSGGDTNRVSVLFLDDRVPANGDGTVSWRRLELTSLGSGNWTGAAPLTAGASRITQWLVQAGDTSGNVGASTNKGRYFIGEPVPPISQNGLTIAVSPAARADGFYNPGTAVSAAGREGVELESSVDGGSFRPYPGPITLTTDGIHTVRFRGSDGSEGSANVAVRARYAQINVTVPSADQEIVVGSVVAPEFECTGVGIASCTASANPLDSSPGSHTVTVTALGDDGVVLSQVTRAYFARYAFEGFFSPVNNVPTFNTMKAGSTAPVKFRLRKAGNVIESSLAAVTKVESGIIECRPGSPIDPVEGELTVVSTSELKFATDQFHYNWKTSKLWIGTCRQLVFTFSDGTTKKAYFEFK